MIFCFSFCDGMFTLRTFKWFLLSKKINEQVAVSAYSMYMEGVSHDLYSILVFNKVINKIINK